MANKRVSVKDKVSKPKQDNLFNPTVEQEVMPNQIEIDNACNNVNNITNVQVDKETSNQTNKYKRQTYFLTDDLINAIAFKSVFDKMDKSEIVREALKSYIENKYFNME